MRIHNTENATVFESRDACHKWINDRVVRFKLRMALGADQHGNQQCVPQKYDGKILDRTQAGFAPSGTDEPLSNYASPVRKDDKWVAVMKVN